jgi:hypothetical protein
MRVCAQLEFQMFRLVPVPDVLTVFQSSACIAEEEYLERPLLTCRPLMLIPDMELLAILSGIISPTLQITTLALSITISVTLHRTPQIAANWQDATR